MIPPHVASAPSPLDICSRPVGMLRCVGRGVCKDNHGDRHHLAADSREGSDLFPSACAVTVGIGLIMVNIPPINEGLKGLGSPTPATRWRPAWGRHPIPGRATGTPPQGGQATAKRAIQTLNVRRVEHLTAGGTPQQRQKGGHPAIPQSVDCPRHGAARVLLHHLGDHQFGPWDQSGTPPCARLPRPKRLPHDINVRALNPALTNSNGPHVAHAATIAPNRPIRSRSR